MGGSVSKTTLNQLTESITEISSAACQSCVVKSTQNQVINKSGGWFSLFSNVKVAQATDIDMKCFQSQNKDLQLQNDITNLIKNSSTADGIALLSAFGSDQSSAESNLHNIIRNNITSSNIQDNMAEIQQSQVLDLSSSKISIIENVDVSQGASVFVASVLKLTEASGVFNTIASHVDQESAAKSTNPLQVFTDLIGKITSTTMMMLLFIILIVIALIFGVFKLFSSDAD